MPTDTHPTAQLGQLALSLVDAEAHAPVLRCAWCARECDTYAAAHDEPAAAIREFLEHCAFDHAAKAPILVMEITREIRLTD